MDRYDVVIVGAGPSGSAAAARSAESGLSTLLIEEQAQIGYPVQCAGLLSNNAFKECQVSGRSVLNTVSGATIRAGEGELSFNAGVQKAYVVDRGILDLEMAKRAADNGAEIRVKTYASRLFLSDHILETKNQGQTSRISYHILIAADGPRSSLARQAYLPRAPVYLSGLQADIPLSLDPQNVIIYPNASPEFFGYVIPTGPGRARVGMCGKTYVGRRFSAFLHQFGYTSVQFVSGTVPLGTLAKTYAEGLMVCGDAAALAKPTSGGGVYTGVRSARHAADMAISACEQGISDELFLSRYQMRWKKDFGRELQIGMAALKARQMISPTGMENLIQGMNDPSILRSIVSIGDMDRPSRVILSVITRPQMIKTGASLFCSMLRSHFADPTVPESPPPQKTPNSE